MIRLATLTIVTSLLSTTFASANPYIWPQPVYTGFPQPGFVQPGFPQPGFVQPGFGPDVAFVRSLYLQYLQREPDPRGMRTWLNRLAQFRGDRQRLTFEFMQAAQRELNANNPFFPAPVNPYGPWR